MRLGCRRVLTAAGLVYGALLLALCTVSSFQLAIPLLLISSLLLATGLWQLQLLPAALGLIGCAAASLLQRHAARPARAHLLG